ncbi:hypothetical protein AAG906_010067 [Vitis piasezkii]
MELISEYFSWCEGGRKSSIDPGDRVSSSASEEEEEAVVGIRVGKNERPLYQRKKKKEERLSKLGQELGQMGKNEVYIYIYMRNGGQNYSWSRVCRRIVMVKLHCNFSSKRRQIRALLS